MYKQGSIEACIEQIKEPCKYQVHINKDALELIISTKDYKVYFVGTLNMLCIENKTKFKFRLGKSLYRIPIWIKNIWSELYE